MRILIADDNKQILSVLKAYAERSGYPVDTTTDGDEALYMAQRVAYDVLLLDVMMPGKDGFAICREVRKTSTVPILMITARGEDYDKIMGLDIGADDYIVKPFSPGEVMARIRAVLRRTEHTFEGKSHILTVSNLAINKETCVVTIFGEPVALTKKEIDLLWMLASDPGKVFTRNLLLDTLWGFDYLGDARTVDSHIRRLRSKLDTIPHPGWTITTIWGMGYKFEVIENAAYSLPSEGKPGKYLRHHCHRW